MRSVVQRVSSAIVHVDGVSVGSIGPGLLVLLAAGGGDKEEDLQWMLDKIVGLRIFEDADAKMNLSILDVSGEMLVVSQFTLYGDCRRGKRPSFTRAMHPDRAEKLISQFVEMAKSVVKKVETGRFGAMMDVGSVNQGPITILLDSEKTF
jgi:D-tyrosyl-tRNA(Tyr) deacylase